MRMSCNGCRVLRKGCSESCTIRPCLQWIKSPEAQGHATVFLAKFYGRAGLLNLIAAGPDHLRPAIFRSLLYEACGRIVNPIFGSVGLLWSGNWNLCQAAVEAVLKGLPIVQLPSEKAAGIPMPPLKASDIRHVTSKKNTAGDVVAVAKTSRTAFKRAAKRPECSPTCSGNGSMVSVETAEAEQPPTPERRSPTDEVRLGLDLDLDLTLGLGSSSTSTASKRSASSDLRTPSPVHMFSPVDLALSPATC